MKHVMIGVGVGMKWKVQVFGQLEVSSPSGLRLRTRSNKFLVLLAYLALSSDRKAPRKAVAEGLFDPTEVDSLANLSLLLTRGQASLSSIDPLPLIEATHSHVGLDSNNVATDVSEFEVLVRRARQEASPAAAAISWREALNVARGMPGLGLDHPLLIRSIDHIREQVLEALVGFVQGPLGEQDADFVLEKVHAFDLESVSSSLAVERLMRVYAALGFKKELIALFTQFETSLDYEFGESVSTRLTKLFEQLLRQIDEPVARLGSVPPKPVATFGRSKLIDDLGQRILGGGNATRLVTLMGLSGIGKSHVLRELYFEVNKQVSCAFFDLELVPVEAIRKCVREAKPDVVFVDHIQNQPHDFVTHLLSLDGHVILVCASQARLGGADEFLVPVGPLEGGSVSMPGAAVQLLKHSIELVHGESSVEHDKWDGNLLVALATKCEGIPLAIEIAGRLAASIGLEATNSALAESLSALSNGRDATSRRRSLAGALESSYRHLGRDARRLLQMTCNAHFPVHIGHLLACSGCLPVDLEEAIFSGLVVRDGGRPFVKVRAATRSMIASVDAEEGALAWAEFCLLSSSWFTAQSKKIPVDLSISDSLPLVAQMVSELISRKQPDPALELLASVRPWIGSAKLPLDLVGTATEQLLNDRAPTAPSWGEAVATLGASYFHASEFRSMLMLLEDAVSKQNFGALDSDLRVQLQMQRGLATRALGDLESAARIYRSAIALADKSVLEGTLVKCYYNLGTIYEHTERLQEALAAHEAAADHFGEDTDPRVENLVNTAIGRLRYRLGGDLASASFILEATLAHAKERQDFRSMGETLQNLGLIAYERGLFCRAALAESIGSLFLIQFGYNTHFRDLAKSSFVTLCASLLELGATELAGTARTLIDRLGEAELYPPNKVIFERVMAQTYRQPALKFRLAQEAEVVTFLRRTCQWLHARSAANGENPDLLSLLLGTDWFDDVDESMPSSPRQA